MQTSTFDNPKKKKLAKKGGFWDSFSSFLITITPFVGFILFMFLPMIVSLVTSFVDLHSSDFSEAKFVWFENYIKLFSGDQGWKTLGAYRTTFVYCINVPISLGIGILCAFLLQKIKKARQFFNTVFFIPYVCSVVATSLIFRMLYEENYGILNSMLSAIGFEKVSWITSEAMFLPSAIIMGSWSGSGMCILLYNAAMSNVDKSYYEAAKIDGASDARMFFDITLPAISPTTFYLLTIKLIGSMQVINEMTVLAGNSAGPNGIGRSAVLDIYDMINVNLTEKGYGIAAAASWILAILILVLTRVNFRLAKKWVCYDF